MTTAAHDCSLPGPSLVTARQRRMMCWQHCLLRPCLYQHVMPSGIQGHHRRTGEDNVICACVEIPQATTAGLPSVRSEALTRPAVPGLRTGLTWANGWQVQDSNLGRLSSAILQIVAVHVGPAVLTCAYDQHLLLATCAHPIYIPPLDRMHL
jgi:hypothetical protein